MQEMVKRVLITGARGMLGMSLAPYLVASGYDVVCHARQGDSAVCADLCELIQTRTLLEHIKPDVIINLAAATNVDQCERNPNQAYLANVKVVENLVDWIRAGNQGTHLIQISTDQVYDGAGPHGEEDVALKNYYAFSKYAGELAALSVAATVLRTNFIGPSQCVGRKSLSDWLFESLAQQKTITVFDDVWFNPLSMRTLSRYIEHVIKQPISGIYNLGSKNGMTKADFAITFAEAMGLSNANMLRGSVNQLKFDAYRPKDMRTDVSRFIRAFGLDLPTFLEEIQILNDAYVQ